MPLDPIVSLTIAVAESPGSYAFLLGSGVSRDAGVSTGAEVFWQTVGALYRLETETEDTPEQAQLVAMEKVWNGQSCASMTDGRPSVRAPAQDALILLPSVCGSSVEPIRLSS